MWDNTSIWVRDKIRNEVHRLGQDQHDSIWVDHEGTVHYSNLQNGDGCGEKSIMDKDAGYEFCPSDYASIDKDYLMMFTPEVQPDTETEGDRDKQFEFQKKFIRHLTTELSRKNIPNEATKSKIDKMSIQKGWISCKDKLPPRGDNVILFYMDTYHTHPSWPKTTVMPAWRANVGEEDTPMGVWKIEGRLGDYCIDIEDGIAWMPMPEMPEVG